MALRWPLYFRQAQFAQVFSLKPTPFFKLSTGLGSTNKSAISLLFSAFRLSLCPPLRLSFHLKLCQIWQELSFLSFFTIRLQWVSAHSYLPRSNAADKVARQGALLMASAIPCSLSALTSRIHSCLFLDRRRIISSKFFDTEVSSVFTVELVLFRHTRCNSTTNTAYS